MPETSGFFPRLLALFSNIFHFLNINILSDCHVYFNIEINNYLKHNITLRTVLRDPNL